METAQDLSLSKRDDDEGDVAMNGENSAPQVWSLTMYLREKLSLNPIWHNSILIDVGAMAMCSCEPYLVA